MTEAIILPALRLKQPIGELYTAVMAASVLMRICEFEYRQVLTGDSPDVEFMGIQRPYSPKRIKDISAYVKTTDATFPTAIVISIDERCVLIENKVDNGAVLLLANYVDSEEPENNIPLEKCGRIIDGQHRLKGIEEAGALDFELPVTIFVGADPATRAEVFSTVNLAQTKVNKSLVYDLFAVSQGRSPQKTAHEVVVALDSAATSPFRYRIKRLGASTRTPDNKPIQGREELLSQATVVRGVLSHISRDVVADLEAERRGEQIRVSTRDHSTLVFRYLYAAKNDAAILINVANYFNAVKEIWPVAWADYSAGAVLNRTNGFDGLIRFLGPLYLRLRADEKVVSKSKYAETLNRVPLKDSHFTVENFPPGSSGASKLFRVLFDALN